METNPSAGLIRLANKPGIGTKELSESFRPGDKLSVRKLKRLSLMVGLAVRWFHHDSRNLRILFAGFSGKGFEQFYSDNFGGT